MAEHTAYWVCHTCGTSILGLPAYFAHLETFTEPHPIRAPYNERRGPAGRVLSGTKSHDTRATK